MRTAAPALALCLMTAPAPAQEIVTTAGTFLNAWIKTTPGVGYLFAGNVYLDQPDLRYPSFAVGAQLNAHTLPGTDQHAWGIATEAWSHPGSRSQLVGIEATTINMEPANDRPKYVMWATYKTRPDRDAGVVPADPGNLNSAALRIEAQAGTGMEKGLSFGADSLHPSAAEPSPVVIDLREVPMYRVVNWQVIRWPDGWCSFYAGQGRLEARRC